jgi:hypothetical protein
VLNIEDKDKCSESTYIRVKGKSFLDINKQYPNFLPQSLLDFVDGKIDLDDYQFVNPIQVSEKYEKVKTLNESIEEPDKELKLPW